MVGGPFRIGGPFGKPYSAERSGQVRGWSPRNLILSGALRFLISAEPQLRVA